jgi:hypothetical protein
MAGGGYRANLALGLAASGRELPIQVEGYGIESRTRTS